MIEHFSKLMPLGVRLGYNKEDNGNNKLHSSLSSLSSTRRESWKDSSFDQTEFDHRILLISSVSEGEVPVELSAEEGLHGGRAVAAQRGLLPLGRQLVESAPELAVEGRQVDVVLGGYG